MFLQNNMKKAVVFTLGCKVNECESDSLITGLKRAGYEVFDEFVPADLYIVNTCAVTSEAEKKSRQTASRIKKLNNNAKIIFTGCATQKNPKSFLDKADGVLVTGVFSKNEILAMLEKEGEFIFPCESEFEELLPPSSLKTRAYVKIEDGCNNFCSYCIIPYLRGRVRSRNPINVKKEVENLSAYEVILNGINISAYNYEGVRLSGLIRKLKDVKKRIRLGSIEVNVIDDELLTALANLYDFAPHFHLSLQSGSNAVLKSMNRKYTAEEFINKVDLIRKYFPLAGITTDIIVGFPTETEENFIETLSLCSRVNFSDIHAFPFSKREGTVAYKMKDLPPEVKKERLSRLLKIKEDCKLSFAKQMENKTLWFLPEEEIDGYTEGYSENYLRLYVKEKVKGKKVKVKVVAPYKDGAIAVIDKGE